MSVVSVFTGISAREQVIGYLTGRMRTSFGRGDIDQAANIEAFISRLESMTDDEYEEVYGDDGLAAD